MGKFKRVFLNSVAVDEKPSISNNSAWNLTSFVIGTTILILTTPIFINYLGITQFGLYSILVTVTGPLSMLNASIARATTKYVAEFQGKDNKKCVNLIGANLSINYTVGILGGVSIWLFSPWLTYHFFNIEPGLWKTAELAFKLTAITWFLTQVSAIFRGVVVGQQNFKSLSIGTLFRMVLWNMGGAGLLLLYPSLNAVLFLQIIIETGFVFYWFSLGKARLSELRFFPYWDSESARKTVGFSSWQVLNTIFGHAAGYADRFILGALLNVSAVGMYTVAIKAMNALRGVSNSILGVLFPAVSGISDTKGESERLILDYGWVVSVLSGWTYAVVFVLGPDLLTFWVGKDIGGPAGIILCILMASLALELPSSIVNTYLLGHALTRWIALNNIFTSCITLIMMMFLCKHYGMLGVAWSSFFGLILTRPIFHIWVFIKRFQGELVWTKCFADIYGPLLSASLGAVIGYILHYSLSNFFGNIPGFFASLFLSPVIICLAVLFSERFLMRQRTNCYTLKTRIRNKVLQVFGKTDSMGVKFL